MSHRRAPSFLFALLCMLPPATGQDAATSDAAADAKALATAFNTFGAELHRELAAKGAPTASPASIAITLAMLLPGARSATADELAAVLHVPAELRGERLAAAMAKLLADVGVTGEVAADAPKLRITNDLWVQAGVPIVEQYSSTLRSAFAAREHDVDFRRDAEAARVLINAAIAKATEQRIPELIPRGAVGADTRLVLSNAIWFKGAWQHPFEERATEDAPFHLASGTDIRVPTMRMVKPLPYAATDDWQCVALPFKGGRLRCELILPRRGKTLAAAEHTLLTGEHLGQLAATSVRVHLPRFTTKSKHMLRERLQQLGLRAACTRGQADFTGITPSEPLFVDEVVHETWIQVDEAGAEAAAATAVVMRAGAARPTQVEDFTADRPFALALRDVPTGLVLFFARVEDPRENAAQAKAGG